MHWFALTDGDLWLSFGNNTIYEYTTEALAYFENKPSRYNDYYLARFLNDFTQMFRQISISVPEKFYNLTKNIEQFREQAEKWKDTYETDESEFSEFYFNEYQDLISWASERKLSSRHLFGGPYISFFRHENKIRILWQTDYLLENGRNLWTAKNGWHEMEYSDFVENVKTFGKAFFKAMDTQVEQALNKEWANINLDKEQLAKEHIKRKEEFNASFSLLSLDTPPKETDWNTIENLYNRMCREI